MASDIIAGLFLLAFRDIINQKKKTNYSTVFYCNFYFYIYIFLYQAY